MQAVPTLVAAALLLTGQPVTDRLAKLTEELGRSDRAETRCFRELVGLLGSGSPEEMARRYQESRGLSAAVPARILLENLIEYGLRPSDEALAALRHSQVAAGPTAATADDVCRCVLALDAVRDSTVLTIVPPEAVGRYWAARYHHSRSRIGEALDDYRRALELDPTNPRTRLLYAIALVAEQRPTEATRILEEIPPDWAPQPVAYWRGRALLEGGDPAGAIRLLEPLRSRWGAEPTQPEAWTQLRPVQPISPPLCLLGQARAAAGDQIGARALLDGTWECRRERGLLRLLEGNPFEALLELEDGGSPSSEVGSLEALAELKACEWARGDLQSRQQRCRTKSRLEGCVLLPSLEAMVNTACATSPKGTDPGTDAGLLARLREPRTVPFEERRVPDHWLWKGERPQATPSVEGYPALKSRAVVTISPPAPLMFAVSVSQDVDPRGEVSAGGYWLHLSRDRGITWGEPFYLGFAYQFPYVVQRATHVPPFDRGHLTLEVERREVDESTITFPPVALRAKQVVANLYLAVDIEAVRKDADGDGLTDLLEEKLGLDPASSDTDSDGIPDAIDPLPLQASSKEETSEGGELLLAVLPHVFGGPAPIQQTAAGEGVPSARSFQPRPFTSARTLFVAGPAPAFPHAAGVRAIALSPPALEEYRRKFGPTYPMAIPDIAFDRNRQRALIRYDFGWKGGQLLAERKNGRWVLTPRTVWIT